MLHWACCTLRVEEEETVGRVRVKEKEGWGGDGGEGGEGGEGREGKGGMEDEGRGAGRAHLMFQVVAGGGRAVERRGGAGAGDVGAGRRRWSRRKAVCVCRHIFVYMCAYLHSSM